MVLTWSVHGSLHGSNLHYMVVTFTTKLVVNVTTQKLVSIVADISSDLY